MDSAQTADKLDANAAADLFCAAQEQGSDLAGGADVGSTTGIAVDAVDLDDANVAGTIGEFAQLASGQHGLGFGAGDVAGGDGTVLGNDFVDQALDVFETMGDGSGDGEVDGGEALAEVKGDGRRVELAQEDGGEEVLAGMLLHVVEAAIPVDAAFDRSACGKRLADEVPDLAVLVFFDGFDGNVEGDATTGDGAQKAGIEWLAAAGGIEGGAVESDLPYRFAFGAGELSDVGNDSGERLEKRIDVIQPLSCGHSLTPRPACIERRRINRGAWGAGPDLV